MRICIHLLKSDSLASQDITRLKILIGYIHNAIVCYTYVCNICTDFEIRSNYVVQVDLEAVMILCLLFSSAVTVGLE